MTAALERGEWSAARPGRTLPPEKTRYPLYRRLGGPQGRSGRAEKSQYLQVPNTNQCASSTCKYDPRPTHPHIHLVLGLFPGDKAVKVLTIL